MRTRILFWFTLIAITTTVRAQGWYEIDSAVTGVNNNDQFGWSADLSADGKRFVIGARFHDILDGNGSTANGGAVIVFEINGNAISQIGSIIEAERTFEEFGICAISGNGNVIAVGGPNYGHTEDAFLLNEGVVRVYSWNGADWIPMGDTIYGGNSNDHLGASVSLSYDGNVMIVGATQNYSGSTSPGIAMVYNFDGVNWNLVGDPLVGTNENDLFGYVVDIDSSGNRIAISSPFYDTLGLISVGKVDVYDLTIGDWVQVGASIVYPYYGLQIGSSMTLSNDGQHIISGSRFDLLGRIFVHSLDGVDWQQKGSELINDGSSYNYGWSVHIDNTGSRIAIGSFDNGFADNKGKVRIYDWNGADWQQFGQVIEGNSYDFLGTSVRLSDNGQYLLATSLGADCLNQTSCGNARFFAASQASISEISQFDQVNIVKTVDCLGREIMEPQQGFFIRIYSDGSSQIFIKTE